MLLTILFVITGGVGLAVLYIEIGGILRRRRAERAWRNERRQDDGRHNERRHDEGQNDRD